MKPTDTAATDLPAADTESTDKPIKQRNNPLHGVTLETVVTELVAYYGWGRLAEQVPLKCFSSDPSIASSLKFLRKTPWAREKVESLYGFMLREIRRGK